MTETFLPPHAPRSPLLRVFMGLLTGLLIFVGGMLGKDLFGALTLRYAVAPGEVIITYGLQTEHIPLDALKGSWVLERPTGVVRRAGTGTGSLKSGSWQTRETGPITLYATRLEPLLVLETESRRYGITPDDLEGFSRALSQRSPATFEPAGGRTRSALSMLFPLALTVVGFGLTSATIWLAGRFPKRLRYELGPDGLTIQTGWRPVRIGYQEIRKVERAEPAGHPLRLWGTHLPGVLWGCFSWKAAGPNLRLYATQARPLLLLHLDGDRTIGISPEEDERFVRALKQRMKSP